MQKLIYDCYESTGQQSLFHYLLPFYFSSCRFFLLSPAVRLINIMSDKHSVINLLSFCFFDFLFLSPAFWYLLLLLKKTQYAIRTRCFFNRTTIVLVCIGRLDIEFNYESIRKPIFTDRIDSIHSKDATLTCFTELYAQSVDKVDSTKSN